MCFSCSTLYLANVIFFMTSIQIVQVIHPKQKVVLVIYTKQSYSPIFANPDKEHISWRPRKAEIYQKVQPAIRCTVYRHGKYPV